jgi:uncharacterized protein YpmB
MLGKWPIILLKLVLIIIVLIFIISLDPVTTVEDESIKEQTAETHRLESIPTSYDVQGMSR